ncbi:MAG TPA: hypothetical protein VD906_03820 [Caulobacteraceae bacterium]|nr:hypothetical protein [Caulobacteraceae bacterium]
MTLAAGGLSGGALGAAFGALGSILNRGFAIFELRERRKDRQLELAHEKERWAHELARGDQARAATAQQALAALELSESRGSWAGLKASLDAEAALAASWPWVAAVRTLTRPALTVMLWLLYALIFVAAASGALRPEAAEGVIGGAVQTISFSAATALTWWFGDRAPRREG